MSASRDIKNNVDAPQSIAPAARTASVNGASADMQNFDSAMGVWNIGLYTDGDFLAKLQESDDDSVFTDVAAADLDGAYTSVDDVSKDNTTQRVGYKGNKRFFRMVITEAGASPAPGTGLVSGGVINRSHAHGTPVA